MIRKFLLSAALLAIAACCQAESKQALTLRMAGGAQIVYFLDSEPSITFEGQTMIVTADGSADRIPIEDVERWEIGEAEFSAAPGREPRPALRIAVSAGAVTVINPEGCEIRIYDLGGNIAGRSDKAEAAFALPAGIYLITASNKTYKIAVR